MFVGEALGEHAGRPVPPGRQAGSRDPQGQRQPAAQLHDASRRGLFAWVVRGAFRAGDPGEQFEAAHVVQDVQVGAPGPDEPAEPGP